MTSAERRYYDANYRLKYYERTGKIPATIGPNSADLGVKLRAPSPGEVDALYRQVDQLKNWALQTSAPPGLTRLVLALDDLSLDDLRRLEVVALAKGGRRAQAAAGRGSRGSRGGTRGSAPGAGRGAGRGSGGGKKPPSGGPERFEPDGDKWWLHDDRVPNIDEFLLEKIMYGIPGTTVGGHAYGMTPPGKKTRNSEFPQWWTERDTIDAFHAALDNLAPESVVGFRSVTTMVWHRGVEVQLRFDPRRRPVEESVSFYPLRGDGVRKVGKGK